MDQLFSLTCDALPGARVRSFTGHESLSHPFRFVVDVQLPEADALSLDLDAALEKPATLTAHRDDGSPRDQVHGVLSSVELVEATPGADARLRVELSPALWGLSLSEHSRVYVKKTLREILTAALRDGGLATSAFDLRLRGDVDTPIEHVSQYRESDLAFASRWMERRGICYFFDHARAPERLIVTDDLTFHARSPAEAVGFAVAGGDEASANEGLYDFGADERAVPRDVALSDYNELQPSMPIDEAAPAWPAGPGSVRRHATDNLDAPDAARTHARLRAEGLTALRRRFHGRGRVFGLHPGFKFAVEGRDGLDGEYVVVELRSAGSNATADTGGATTYRVDVVAVPAGVQFRPELRTPWPRVRGPVIAVIDGPGGGDYAQLDEHGRYLVRVNYDEATSGAGQASMRIRMLQPHAGAPEGMHFPLRAGTEVMLTFLDGDPDRPVIVGSVPNQRTPSVVTHDNRTYGVIQTGAENRVEFQDEDGKQHVDWYCPEKRSFLHLGAPHDGHKHHYVASTDGNGLLHTGGDLEVFVDGKKTEDVVGDVSENYGPQSTTVTLSVTESCASMKTTVTGLCYEGYGNQITETKNDTEENTGTQNVSVTALLTERHQRQTTNVSGTLTERCKVHVFTCSGASDQHYGTLNITANSGTIMQSGPVKITTTTFTLNNTALHMIDAPHHSSQTVLGMKFYPFKMDLVASKNEITGASAGAVGGKFELVQMVTGLALAKLDFGVIKIDVASASFELTSLKITLGAFKMSTTFTMVL